MKQKILHVLQKAVYAVSVVFDFIYRILLTYSAGVLLAIVFVVSAQVFSRKFLGASIQWSEEVARLLMVWMAFISMAIGIQKGLHVCIEIFYNKFPRVLRSVIAKTNEVIMCICGVVMVIYGLRLIASTSTSTLSATQWPASTLYLMIPVSGLFIFYFSSIELFGLQKYIKTSFEHDGETEAALAAASEEEVVAQ